MGIVLAAGITVQRHRIAMVEAEQGFDPAIIDSFPTQAKGTVHIR